MHGLARRPGQRLVDGLAPRGVGMPVRPAGPQVRADLLVGQGMQLDLGGVVEPGPRLAQFGVPVGPAGHDDRARTPSGQVAVAVELGQQPDRPARPAPAGLGVQLVQPVHHREHPAVTDEPLRVLGRQPEVLRELLGQPGLERPAEGPAGRVQPYRHRFALVEAAGEHGLQQLQHQLDRQHRLARPRLAHDQQAAWAEAVEEPADRVQIVRGLAGVAVPAEGERREVVTAEQPLARPVLLAEHPADQQLHSGVGRGEGGFINEHGNGRFREGRPGRPPAFELTGDQLGRVLAVVEARGHEGPDEVPARQPVGLPQDVRDRALGQRVDGGPVGGRGLPAERAQPAQGRLARPLLEPDQRPYEVLGAARPGGVRRPGTLLDHPSPARTSDQTNSFLRCHRPSRQQPSNVCTCRDSIRKLRASSASTRSRPTAMGTNPWRGM